MSMQDPIADLFSRINNAQSRRKTSVVVPSSKKKINLLSLLKDTFAWSGLLNEGLLLILLVVADICLSKSP